MPRPRRIEGYAIVSEDGMLANAAGIMPDSLKFEADQHFFERGLDGVDVVVHGRHSHERQPRSYLRRLPIGRLITYKLSNLALVQTSGSKSLSVGTVSMVSAFLLCHRTHAGSIGSTP